MDGYWWSDADDNNNNDALSVTKIVNQICLCKSSKKFLKSLCGVWDDL